MQRVPEQKPRSIEVPDTELALPMSRDVGNGRTMTRDDVSLFGDRENRSGALLPATGIYLDFFLDPISIFVWGIPGMDGVFLASQPLYMLIIIFI